MILKRMLPLVGIMLVLAGCFRQAEDSFDTVGSQNSGGSVITEEVGVTIVPTEPITIIDPNASPDANAQTVEDASSTPRTISPTDSDTAVVSASSTPRPVVTSQSIPTATEVTFVTPDIVEEVAQPTTTQAPESIQPTLQPTPTAIGGEIVAGDCQYQVQDGDNLFRISLNNEVDLGALLSANGLTEASVIQPGQLLNLPNCEGGDVSAPVETDETEIEDAPIILEDCDYEIQSGDSLFNIAFDNDVSLADLLAQNGLTEESIIQPGQILRLPNCIDGSEEVTPEAPVISPESTEDLSTATDSDDTIHTVIAGDTILTIARQYSVTVNSLIQANSIPDPNNLTVGQQLVIPE